MYDRCVVHVLPGVALSGLASGSHGLDTLLCVPVTVPRVGGGRPRIIGALQLTNKRPDAEVTRPGNGAASVDTDAEEVLLGPR